MTTAIRTSVRLAALAALLYASPTVATPPSSVPTRSAGPLRVEEQRRHQTYNGLRAQESATPPGRPDGAPKFPESTFILRRWKNSKGTERVEFEYLVDFGNGIRLKKTIDTDYFTCRSVENISVEWRDRAPEYVRIAESLEKCPDFTQESYMKWVRENARGDGSWLPANHLKTVETKTVKVGVDAKEWAPHGNEQIRDSLSADFAQVVTGDLTLLARVDSFASTTCQDLAGLYTLRCDTSPDASRLLGVHKPDCEFDATFGEPCSADEQQQFENRKAHGVLNPSPTPAP